MVVVRSKERSGSLNALLREGGATPIFVPALEFVPPTDSGPLTRAVADLTAYDWIVFTSATGVEFVAREIEKQGHHPRELCHVCLAAIGPATAAALQEVAAEPDFVPTVHEGQAFAEQLCARLAAEGTRSGRILFPRAEEGRDVIVEELRARGHSVELVSAYKTMAPPPESFAELARLLRQGRVDAIMFTSPSTVEHVCAALGKDALSLLTKTAVAVIGPVTADAAKRLGVRVDVRARHHSAAGLVAALEEHFAETRI